MQIPPVIAGSVVAVGVELVVAVGVEPVAVAESVEVVRLFVVDYMLVATMC